LLREVGREGGLESREVFECASAVGAEYIEASKLGKRVGALVERVDDLYVFVEEFSGGAGLRQGEAPEPVHLHLGALDDVPHPDQPGEIEDRSVQRLVRGKEQLLIAAVHRLVLLVQDSTETLDV